MAESLAGEDDLFENLRRQTDPKKLEAQEKEQQEKQAALNAQAQERLAQLIGSNSTLPTTINSINLIGSKFTRRSFLDKIFDPLLSANQDRPFTLVEALQEVGSAADKLKRFEIFHEPISTFIDRPDPSDPNSSPNDINVYISARERGRVSLKTGTDLGNAEGSAYGNLTWRNIFGGAESLNFNASAGTRTRSAYSAIFDTPIQSDPDKRLTVDALVSSTHKPWSSHEEVLRGGGVKYNWIDKRGATRTIGYSGIWRQITSLAANASPTVRNDAGDSVKSSISHTWLKDKRNHPFIPSSGYMFKSVSEIAGWGPLQGDVAWWKSEMETLGAVAIPIPGIEGDSGVSLTAGLRAGVLWPLPLGFGTKSKASRLNDRFQLGGPTDVRGFKLSGLGPRDCQDAVGGDVFAALSANLLFPVPTFKKDTPLRLQVFANAGRLLALNNIEGKGYKETQQSVYKTMGQLIDGSTPSLSAGVGLVYAHPVARFELNFGLPLVVRRGEEGRKGLQFGVGINFM